VHPTFILFVLGFLSPVLAYNLYVLRSYLTKSLSKEPEYIKLPKYRILVAKVHRLMFAFNPYYKSLSRSGKWIFISRVIHIMVYKKFEGREGLLITLEKKIIVIGALVQLTYRLKRYTLPKFSFVALSPSTFFSKLINKEVKGLTYRKGAILLSWLDVLNGYAIKDDNFNLALHEWAHAFIIDHYDDVGYWVYTKLNKSLTNLDGFYAEMQTYRASQNYLREYAFTNTHEFFAVCVEHFFETPLKFNQKYPELFHDLCIVLNQNPLNQENDYALIKI
jgi:MtfA peptidase